jgi:hypothetical protein
MKIIPRSRKGLGRLAVHQASASVGRYSPKPFLAESLIRLGIQDLVPRPKLVTVSGLRPAVILGKENFCASASIKPFVPGIQ